MGRFYTAVFENVSVSAVQDVFEALAATGKPFWLHKIEMTQVGVADIGDAAEEFLRVQIKRATGSYTSGSSGSTATFQKHSTNDAAAGPTCEINNTSQAAAGSGALTIIEAGLPFNVRAGFQYLPVPEHRIFYLATEACVVSLGAAPADAITLSGSITIEEM